MWTLDAILTRVAGFIPVLLSLSVHEWAHAWTAWRLGDDTAKLQGRMSLNPVDHIDPIGTLLLPLLGVPFGWAKPVPINPLRFRQSISMPMGVLITAAAGPVSNLVLGGISCVLLAALSAVSEQGHSVGIPPGALFAITELLQSMVLINFLLAVFNLLPITPLDGSRIADALMPNAVRPLWNRFSELGPLMLMAVILLPGLFQTDVLSWPIQWVRELLNWLTDR